MLPIGGSLLLENVAPLPARVIYAQPLNEVSALARPARALMSSFLICLTGCRCRLRRARGVTGVCARRIRLAGALILFEVQRIARACPLVPEEEELESVRCYLHGRGDEAEHHQGRHGEYHPVPGRDLPSLGLRGCGAAVTRPWLGRGPAPARPRCG